MILFVGKYYKMKIVICLFTSLILIGCNSSSEKKKEVINAKTKKDNESKYVNIPNGHFGFWVYEEYLKALDQTKSTKKASKMGVDIFYKISKDNSIMGMSLHDSGAKNILIMTTKSEGQIFSLDTTNAYNSVEFKDNYLIIENKRFVKAPPNENGLIELVNKTLFSGEYEIENKTIEFKKSGQIVGLDSIINYEVNLDYLDVGMQYDKIHLQFREEKEARVYLYEFVSDNLVLYQIDCKSMENEYCLEVEKGEEFIRLKKK